MLSDPLSLKKADETAVSYTVSGYAPNGAGSTRVMIGSTPSEPMKLVIKQQVSGVGSQAVRRTLVSFDDVVLDASNVPSHVVTNLSIALPLNNVATADMVKDQLRKLIDLIATTGTVALDGTNLDALLIGQS